MGKKLNVLIVEDCEDDALLLLRELKQGGMEPEHLRVDSARAMGRALADREWDLVISDYSIPGFGGLAALRLLKETGQDLPFIMVSGVTGEEIAVEVMREGACDYLIKKEMMTWLVPVIERELREAAGRRKRRQAEQDLLEGQAQYRLLTEQIADGITLIQGGAYLFVNSAFAEMLGYTSSDQLMGKKALRHLTGEWRRQARAWVADLENGDSSQRSFEGECLAAGGRKFWVGVNIRVIKWQGRNAVLMTVRDITEQMNHKQQLEAEFAALATENRLLKSSMKDLYRFGDMIGKSQAMQKVYKLVARAAATDAGVIIYGESGTGKELAARAIHDMSSRGHFVPVNCGAIPEELLESEFFGYKKGAFTGAHTDKAGLLEHADGGTLFLDEIGELSLNLQVKLLRAIEGGGYSPVGSIEVRKPDIRIIAATNRDLAAQVKKGEMREDFYYRVNIIPVTLPPLRERREDLPLLVHHFFKQFGAEDNLSKVNGKMIDAMHCYKWPGNIRELQNVLHRFLTLGTLELEGAHPGESDAHAAGVMEISDPGEQGLQEAMKQYEKKLLLNALERNKWHRGNTARDLKLPPRTFFKKMKDHRLTSA